jgi:hypothetical protein
MESKHMRSAAQINEIPSERKQCRSLVRVSWNAFSIGAWDHMSEAGAEDLGANSGLGGGEGQTEHMPYT